MKIITILLLTLNLYHLPLVAKENDYQLDFGVILQNDNGEPIGFEKTELIPISKQGQPSLYGLMITSSSADTFTLSSVHILPNVTEDNLARKVIGKSMIVKKRGAILLRTDTKDLPGAYKMEIYIDNELLDIIDYELIAPKITLTKL